MNGATTPSANREVAAFELESLALLHAIEGGTAYGAKILNSWRWRSYLPGQMTNWVLPYQVMAHSLALDYLWNDLTPAQRVEIGTVIVAMMDDLYDYAPYNVSFPNQMSDYSNQLFYHLGALAFAGIVLSGEGINDARAAFYLSEADSLLRNRMIPPMNQEAGGDAELTRLSDFVGNGGWGEDMGHLEMTHPLFGRMVEAWRTGTGEDLFPAINGLRKFANYVVYMMRPSGELAPKANGNYEILMSDKNYGTLGCLVAARYGDPLGNFLKQSAYSGSVFGFHQVGAVLWCDPAPTPPNFAAMPRTMHFQGQGEVVTRSGFGTQDTWVYLRSGPIYNGHQHDDQGNLLVDAYGAELLVENASETTQETRFHNSIRVAGIEQIPYGNNAIQQARPLAGTVHERGRVTTVQAQPTYSYVATDFSNAYPDSVVPAPKTGKVTREVVTILPDIIVVRDRVAGAGVHEVLLHAWAGSATLIAAAREWNIARGTGQSWIKTMFPASATVEMTLQGTTDLLTVRATGSAGSFTDFLHVVHVTPSGVVAAPTNLTLINSATELGVSMTDRRGQPWSVVFQRAGVGLLRIGGGTGLPPPPTNLRIIPPPS
jgi:hypothetical protein